MSNPFTQEKAVKGENIKNRLSTCTVTQGMNEDDRTMMEGCPAGRLNLGTASMIQRTFQCF
jgi:hypothetical protein